MMSRQSEAHHGADLPRFQTGEYVILTQAYLGVPSLSVGVVTKIHSTKPPLYLIHFGESIPTGPFPETALSRLPSPRTRRA